MDWNFTAEPSPAVNNRSIHQAMGKALGGGTSINGMVWARGHKNDFDQWAQEAGDQDWSYAHVLEIYKRIEDWHGAPDPTRRGTGGIVFVQAAPDPNPMAPAFLEAAPAQADAAEANAFVKSRPDLDTPDLHIWHIEAPARLRVYGVSNLRVADGSIMPAITTGNTLLVLSS